MAVKNPQFEINIRKNINANNPGYGKYYPKAVEKETISLRGLCKHMAEHNSIYGRDIIQGVLMKMSSCIAELLSQGNPVKIDGLGTFVPTIESTKEGITRAALLEGKWNATTYVKAVHIRFRPEGAAEDNHPSVAFKGTSVRSPPTASRRRPTPRRGAPPPEEAVHQEGDPARGLDRRAEGAESLIERRHRR